MIADIVQIALICAAPVVIGGWALVEFGWPQRTRDLEARAKELEQMAHQAQGFEPWAFWPLDCDSNLSRRRDARKRIRAAHRRLGSLPWPDQLAEIERP